MCMKSNIYSDFINNDNGAAVIKNIVRREQSQELHQIKIAI